MAPEIEEPSGPVEEPRVSVEGAGEDTVEDSRMTLKEHLQELRARLFRGSIAFVIAFAVLYTYREPVNSFIKVPYETAWSDLHERLVEVRREQVAEDPDVQVSDHFIKGDPDWVLKSPEKDLASASAFKPGGTFFVKIKICFLLSLFVAGPIFLWEIWMFVAAGLYKKEKRVVYLFLPPSLVLFFVGVAFGFKAMVPAAIYFTQADGLGVDGYMRQMDVDQYLVFLRSLSLALGVVFQLPLFQVALSRIGLVNPANYARYRGHMAIIALVLAAFITPPDPVTQILLAGPAIALWEVGYWVSRLVWKEPDSELTTEDEESAVA